MRYKLRSLDVLSVAKLMACVHGCIGLLFMPIFLLAFVGAAATGGQNAAFGASVMIIFSLMMPVIYAVMGFVMGALMAWLYNFVSKHIGAIECRLDLVESTPAPVVPAL